MCGASCKSSERSCASNLTQRPESRPRRSGFCRRKGGKQCGLVLRAAGFLVLLMVAALPAGGRGVESQGEEEAHRLQLVTIQDLVRASSGQAAGKQGRHVGEKLVPAQTLHKQITPHAVPSLHRVHPLHTHLVTEWFLQFLFCGDRPCPGKGGVKGACTTPCSAEREILSCKAAPYTARSNSLRFSPLRVAGERGEGLAGGPPGERNHCRCCLRTRPPIPRPLHPSPPRHAFHGDGPSFAAHVRTLAGGLPRFFRRAGGSAPAFHARE